MTVDFVREIDNPTPVLKTVATAVIIAEHDVIDSALAVFVEDAGLHAVIIDLDHATDSLGGLDSPAITIVRSQRRIAQVRSIRALNGCMIGTVGVPVSDPRTVDITDPGHALDVLTGLAGRSEPGHPRIPRVHVTEREREVLTAYVLGATLRETARRFFIAESTAREHYRRVRQRYLDAGRPVANKAELLLALIADGWVRPEQL
ncbi:helix-turn-helix transcriptional regulator [Gordonia otitidis]|uniref:Two-component response regulator n=1 Tax=Gordonia otitidis (strain DSM 44809 / CCUG 52243 / JCM 12355 / NBRC 100426 / IFM 10032) TaxID=1108044 RepID=H5TKF2_GORO1|nr:hypothetical protein [Gordonia otitidis]UEA61065.1 regulator [Gordonia otitidis]GAB33960.1 putative two-component response regulator [Gordonia otitidis NBRC 100426]